MQQFLEYVLRQLVEYPEEIVLTHQETPRKTVFYLRLRRTDVGKVIGKHGQTIRAIRSLLSASAARSGQRAMLQILE
jgi:predicted RNA-binding protein YlqC (UPF0109 family)